MRRRADRHLPRPTENIPHNEGQNITRQNWGLWPPDARIICFRVRYWMVAAALLQLARRLMTHSVISRPSITALQKVHSITSSAATSSDGGTVRPSALAVLTLMARSNLVGCSIGRSAGFAPFMILSTKVAARRYRSERSTP